MDYTIENQWLRVTVCDDGAQLKSVVRKCDGVEHIWQADAAVWKYHSPVLFPYCGKVKDGRIEIRGQVVENAPAHGVARIQTHRLLEQGDGRLSMELCDNEQTRTVFPYHFRLVSVFELEGACVRHTLRVINTDTEAFSFGIGYHPAFAIPFDGRHSIGDYELRFSEMESPLCLDTPSGLLNGRYYSLCSNIRSIPVEHGMFNVGSHCMVGLRSRTLGIYEKESGRGVRCSIENFPYCLIWSTEGTPHFICIEPWHSLPSAQSDGYRWEDKAAAATVAPGESWSTTMQSEFVR